MDLDIGDKNIESLFTNCLKNVLKNISKLGFKVVKQEGYFHYLRFFDIGALVCFAKIIEWEFPDFSVEKHFEQLIKIQNSILNFEFVESSEH